MQGENDAVSAPSSAVPPGLRLALIICFFASGAASLVLEVVWTRSLRMVFGTTTLAISTILVAFMAGLGAGGLAGGRLAARVRNPVRAYGAVEIGIGLYALAVPLLVATLPALASGWTSAFGYWPSALLRFLVSLVLLLPPTFGMGLTLPLITQTLVRESRAGSNIAVLYGVNTLGAVAGVLLAAFALLPALGVRGSSYAAGAVDLFVGALALLLARALRPAPPAPAPLAAEGLAAERLARWNPALLAYGTVGFSALVYEVVWARALAMVLGSSLYAFACMLAAFLLGIGFGSLAMRPVVERVRRPILVYALGIAALGAVSLVCLLILPGLPALFMGLVRASGGSATTLALAQFGVSSAVMLPPALVLGALFPLLARAQAAAEGAAPATGDVYFANTVGSALGAFSAGFLLLPTLGLRGTAALAIALNGVVAAGLLLWRGADRPARRALLAAPPLALAAWMAVAPPSLDTKSLALGGFGPERIFSTAPEVAALEGVPDEEILFYRDGLSATVSVHRYRGEMSLHTNGKADASSLGDMPTQVLLGEIPLLFGQPARRVLVIGWASGVTVGSVVRHPVERIDAVELEPAMLEASRFFDAQSGRPIDDPRVHVIADDGRAFLAGVRESYDVIISEPSNPWLSGVANLFTRENFRAARAALAPGGRLMQWFPLYGTDPPALRSLLAALRAEFPYVYGFVLDRRIADLVLLATLEPLTPADLPRFEALPEAVRSDLQRVGTSSTSDLWSLLRLLPSDVDALVGSDADLVVNGDDNLFLELRSPWLLYGDDFAPPGQGPSEQVFGLIDQVRLGGWPLLEPAAAELGIDPGELALSYMRARRDGVVAETLAELAGDSGAGITARAELARFARASDAVSRAAALDSAVAAAPDSFTVRLIRANARLSGGDLDGALADSEAALRLRPTDLAAAGTRANALLALGRPADALAGLEPVRATESAALDPSLWLLTGRAALAAGRADLAARELERYLAVEPGLVSGWRLLEQAYDLLGQPGDASRARHNQGVNLYMISLGAERDGDTERARQVLRRALEVLPEYAPARAALERLGG